MSPRVSLLISPELNKTLQNTPRDLRLIKIVVHDESVDLVKSVAMKGSFSDDWDNQIVPECLQTQSCLILYRLDSTKGDSYEYILITWIPDSTRNKMIISLAQSQIMKLFGRERIVKIISSASMPEEVKLSAYMESLNAKAEDSLSSQEREFMGVKMAEKNSVINPTKTINSIQLPIEEAALTAIENLKEGKVNLLHLSLDPQVELIKCSTSSTMETSKVGSLGLVNGFVLYRYDHVRDHEKRTVYVFAYIIPGYGSSIKERMLYASSKAGLLKYLNSLLEKVFTAELEDLKEFSEDFVTRLVYPPQDAQMQKIVRPTGPRNRGPRRLE